MPGFNEVGEGGKGIQEVLTQIRVKGNLEWVAQIVAVVHARIKGKGQGSGKACWNYTGFWHAARECPNQQDAVLQVFKGKR